MSVDTQTHLETQLNDFDPARRRAALDELIQMADQGVIELPEPGHAVNMHCHTFYSFNGYGYSPTCFAWKARQAGLAVAGVVDFDVLDAVEEFLDAASRLNLRAAAGLETRLFLPEFSSREINSPGEPGITYHMGMGFPKSDVPDKAFLAELKELAQRRTQGLIERVNGYLTPVEVDYHLDVTPWTPNGNVTERHVCQAYEAKAAEVFPDEDERVRFWAQKLKTDSAEIKKLLGDSPAMQALIRSKTMKRGGPGYVQPDSDAFPRLNRFNRFALEAHALPTLTWLDGTSAGEQAMDELLDLHMDAGTAALNIIPDRNWNIADPETKKIKVANLYDVVEKAMDRGLPIVVGTEMNAYGQRFVDDFDAEELQPVASVFCEGAYIMYAHTVMQRHAGLGYLSEWAKRNYPSLSERNAFFAQVGRTLEPQHASRLGQLPPNAASDEIYDAVHGLRA